MGRETLGDLVAHTHQTLSYDACRYHHDVTGKGLETKVVFTLGPMLRIVNLPRDGELCDIVESTLVFVLCTAS